MSESLAVVPSNLPGVANAKLPAIYSAAKEALAECSRLDECQEWANKSEALASYAKQAGDDTLRKHADRIQARAIRRCGELLAAIKPASGKRTDKEPRDGADHRLVEPPTRKEAARDAGLSERQQKTALRVAKVPERDFEEAVEAEEPPTVTELAERGKQARPLVDLGGRDPREFSLSTDAQGDVRRLAELAGRIEPAVVVRGAFPKERKRLYRHAMVILNWTQELVAQLEDCNDAE